MVKSHDWHANQSCAIARKLRALLLSREEQCRVTTVIAAIEVEMAWNAASSELRQWLGMICHDSMHTCFCLAIGNLVVKLDVFADHLSNDHRRLG
jgi:hypothetical protein